MELLLLGRWMDAREAHQRGIVNEVVAAEELMPRARAMAALLAAGPPLVFAAIKEVSRESETLSFTDAMQRIRHRRFPSVGALYSSDDQKEGARAFAAKRAPVWRGR
jgi:crotonobetainyl-CoA hydratase